MKGGADGGRNRRSIHLGAGPQGHAPFRRHYRGLLYIGTWNPEHFHSGLFEAGEYPGEGEAFAGPASLTRGLERMIEAVVAPAAIRENHHVVDAGCGIGGTAIYLARTRGCTVTGVNLHRVQLEIAQGKAKDAGLERRVGFEYGDCSRHLPFADESIDTVVNIESACHFAIADNS